MLFRLRSIRLSSKSENQAGYALVLAYTSVICNVDCKSALALRDFILELFLFVSGNAIGVADKGSTCTISSQVWTMALIKEVLPTPGNC
jgi:hypothetical protein